MGHESKYEIDYYCLRKMYTELLLFLLKEHNVII